MNAGTEPRQQPRWTRRKDARPEEISAAALDLFVERGYAGTRLDDVAARAGVSKGTVYLYFASKEDLFKAVVREGLVSPLTEFRSSVLEQYRGSTFELTDVVRKSFERSTECARACEVVMCPILVTTSSPAARISSYTG